MYSLSSWCVVTNRRFCNVNRYCLYSRVVFIFKTTPLLGLILYSFCCVSLTQSLTVMSLSSFGRFHHTNENCRYTCQGEMNKMQCSASGCGHIWNCTEQLKAIVAASPDGVSILFFCCVFVNDFIHMYVLLLCWVDLNHTPTHIRTHTRIVRITNTNFQTNCSVFF